MKVHHSSQEIINGIKYRFDIFLCTDFSKLKKIKQVYGVILNKQFTKILVVFDKVGHCLLPGGKFEKGETMIDTLIREVREETNRDIFKDLILPIFYQSEYRMNNQGNWVFQGNEVRFLSVIQKEARFYNDPDDGEIISTKWIEIDQLDKVLKWGETSVFIRKNIPIWLTNLQNLKRN